MDSPPVLLRVESELGQRYHEAMQLAGAYAYAGRDVVVDKVLEILGAKRRLRCTTTTTSPGSRKHHGETVVGHPEGMHARVPGPAGFVGSTMGRTP